MKRDIFSYFNISRLVELQVELHVQVWLNCRIPRNSFPSHWITKVTIVLCLVLQSISTLVNELKLSGVAGYSAIAPTGVPWKWKENDTIRQKLSHYCFLLLASFIRLQFKAIVSLYVSLHVAHFKQVDSILWCVYMFKLAFNSTYPQNWWLHLVEWGSFSNSRLRKR